MKNFFSVLLDSTIDRYTGKPVKFHRTFMIIALFIGGLAFLTWVACTIAFFIMINQ
jgi:hypothetical protein